MATKGGATNLGYLRVSTEEQADSGLSLAARQAALVKRAEVAETAALLAG